MVDQGRQKAKTQIDRQMLRVSCMVSCKQYVDEIALAADLARQGGATGLAHQGRPVSILDCQIVIVTIGMGLNVEGSEF